MLKYIIGVVLVAILATGGYYVWEAMNTEQGTTPPPGPSQQQLVPSTATTTYATSTFSLVHPADFVIDTSYAYEGVPNKPIAGIKFTIPGAMATGTNLSSDTGLSIESLPRAQTCTGDIFVLQDVPAIDMTENGIAYSIATTSSAAAGNRYEERVYALKNSSPCTAVRYFIHSTNIGNYATGTVREFNEDALIRVFDEIRLSLKLGR
jgi:hypothetical protein